jgi:hypothetical protein
MIRIVVEALIRWNSFFICHKQDVRIRHKWFPFLHRLGNTVYLAPTGGCLVRNAEMLAWDDLEFSISEMHVLFVLCWFVVNATSGNREKSQNDAILSNAWFNQYLDNKTKKRKSLIYPPACRFPNGRIPLSANQDETIMNLLISTIQEELCIFWLRSWSLIATPFWLIWWWTTWHEFSSQITHDIEWRT